MLTYCTILFVVYFLIGLTYYSWPKETGCYIFGALLLSIFIVFAVTLQFGTIAMAGSSIPLMVVGLWLGNMLDPKR